MSYSLDIDAIINTPSTGSVWVRMTDVISLQKLTDLHLSLQVLTDLYHKPEEASSGSVFFWSPRHFEEARLTQIHTVEFEGLKNLRVT